MAYYREEEPEMYHRLTRTGTYQHIQSNEELIRDIKIATQYWHQKFAGKKHHYLIYQQYCCFLLETPYVPVEHLPPHEDMHVEYQFRYPRKCYWLSHAQLSELSKSAFHCRIQTPFWNWIVQQRLARGTKGPNRSPEGLPAYPPGITIDGGREKDPVEDKEPQIISPKVVPKNLRSEKGWVEIPLR
jgi:hypothetical protein